MNEGICDECGTDPETTLELIDELIAAKSDLTARLAELAEALDDLIVLSESAMHAANRDGGEYDVDDALADARDALKKAGIKS